MADKGKDAVALPAPDPQDMLNKMKDMFMVKVGEDTEVNVPPSVRRSFAIKIWTLLVVQLGAMFGAAVFIDAGCPNENTIEKRYGQAIFFSSIGFAFLAIIFLYSVKNSFPCNILTLMFVVPIQGGFWGTFKYIIGEFDEGKQFALQLLGVVCFSTVVSWLCAMTGITEFVATKMQPKQEKETRAIIHEERMSQRGSQNEFVEVKDPTGGKRLSQMSYDGKGQLVNATKSVFPAGERRAHALTGRKMFDMIDGIRAGVMQGRQRFNEAKLEQAAAGASAAETRRLSQTKGDAPAPSQGEIDKAAAEAASKARKEQAEKLAMGAAGQAMILQDMTKAMARSQFDGIMRGQIAIGLVGWLLACAGFLVGWGLYWEAQKREIMMTKLNIHPSSCGIAGASALPLIIFIMSDSVRQMRRHNVDEWIQVVISMNADFFGFFLASAVILLALSVADIEPNVEDVGGGGEGGERGSGRGGGGGGDEEGEAGRSSGGGGAVGDEEEGRASGGGGGTGGEAQEGGGGVGGGEGGEEEGRASGGGGTASGEGGGEDNTMGSGGQSISQLEQSNYGGFAGDGSRVNTGAYGPTGSLDDQMTAFGGSDVWWIAADAAPLGLFDNNQAKRLDEQKKKQDEYQKAVARDDETAPLTQNPV